MAPEDKEKLEKALGYIEAIISRGRSSDAISYSLAIRAELLITEVLERDR